MGASSANRPFAAAGGTLAKTPLIHLLLYAVDRNLAGTIAFTSPDGQLADVFFVGGRPAKVRTSETVATLGRVLVDAGAITPADLARSMTELAVARAAAPALHGEILLASGLIDDDTLLAALREQIARKLRHVAGLPGETAYTFYDGYDGLADYGAPAARGFDPVPMIWRLLRDSPPRSHIEPALARIGTAALRLTRQSNLTRLGLDREHGAAAELLGIRPMSIAELSMMGALGEAETRLLVYLLLATKQIEIARAEGEPLLGREPHGVLPEDASRRFFRPAGVPARSPLPLSAHQPVAASNGAAAIAGSTTGSAPPPGALSPELAARWAEIVDRASTIDRSDYFEMLGIGRDASLDRIESAFYALARRWHPDRLPNELGAVRDACSRVFARMSEAHKTLSDEGRRIAYVGLLADGSGSPETQETVAKVIEAATNYQKAEVCLRRNALAQAEELCKKALDADPTQPDYLATMAWLIAQKPASQTPEKTKECIAMLDRAIDMSARCEKAYFWRGMLQKRLNRTDAAYRDFRQVVELNPRNIDAAREVRLFRMRNGRRSSAPPTTAGRSNAPPPRPSSSVPAKSGKTEEGKPNLLGRLFKR